MKIIDSKKDFYDYLSGVYGMDELAVYDRRGSMTWAQYKERFPLFIDTKRVKDDLFIPLKKSRWWRPHRRFLCVEAGKRQFLIMAERQCWGREPWRRSIPKRPWRSSSA